MSIKQEWEKDGASPQPIFVIGDRSISQADMAAALEQFERRDTGLTKREALIAAIAGSALLTPAVGEKNKGLAGQIYAARVVDAADAIIDELQYRDDERS